MSEPSLNDAIFDAWIAQVALTTAVILELEESGTRYSQTMLKRIYPQLKAVQKKNEVVAKMLRSYGGKI